MRSVVAWGVVWGVAILAVAGCSSGDPEPTLTGSSGSSGSSDVPGASASSTIAGGEAGSAKADGSTPAPTGGSGETESAPTYSVAIDVSVERLDLAEGIEVVIEPGGLTEIDPFDRFSSCSGLRASIGTFTVTAVDASAPVRAVSVVTVDRVTGPGVYDADVRIESAGHEPVGALGTVTLDPTLRSGTFQAFEPTGEVVSGSFACDGPPGAPVPIVEPDAGGDDGVVRAVEVVALLRRGDEERIVGLTLDTNEVAAADAECPGAIGVDEPTLVRVDGGQAVGAITSFELTAEPPSLLMQVGGMSYAVDDVVIDTDEPAATGTFSGITADGIAIDGAFRCV